ncbi:hypothetical protein BO78DRAFT_449233 [Aspergillus sclerotiicarbonarius CBS 121057]|uniref:CoA-dependent acyltransferase n=1 Tax=Aspergillus sclerotiicarbonarius (strain CBS 121057 / IBT 28362) TaxID=1448318 RepID=A0A319ELK9_ASPSB|nr:hypothetical protein BO78DRAFT_449233 [Aspergillus sclerotiicarbonarius CBS 121057]
MGSSKSDYYYWREVRPGRWERNVDEAEQFYTSLAKAYEGTGRTFFAITGAISLAIQADGELSSQETGKRAIAALQSAWIRIRYDHPTIASRVEYDRDEKRCNKVYETITETSSLHHWTDTTFRVISNGISAIEWCNSDPPVPKLPTLFLLKTSSEDTTFRADLVLRAHHDIIDGMGTLILFNNLFAHAAQAYTQDTGYSLPQFGGEWVNLSPPLRDAAEIPTSLSEAQEERLYGILNSNASSKKDVEIASPPFNKQNAFPGKHQRVAIFISPDQTKQLLDKCRGKNLSVTHAYHAAIAVTVRDKQERGPEGRNVRYINYCLINERNHCKQPYSTSAHPASVYHSVSGRCLTVDMRVPALPTTAKAAITGGDSETEFMDIARSVRDFYLGIRDDNEHISLVPSFWAMSTIPYPVDGTTHGIPPRNDAPSVSISSMGVLDKVIRHEHGPFQLNDPWVTGEELGTGIGLFLGTWKGVLTLSAAYNDAWHDKGEVMDFLECCNHATFLALGVDE